MNRVSWGFILAGLYNSAIGIFSYGFGGNLGAVDPLFSTQGCIAIQLWGLAYIALKDRYDVVPAMSLVFCLEKLFYGVHWLLWLSAHGDSLTGLMAHDFLTGLFFYIYGAGDFIFMVFFGCAAWRWRPQSQVA